LRAEKVSLPFFEREAVGDLVDKRTYELFLLVDGHSKLSGKIGQQEFFFVVVVNNRGGQRAVVSTGLACNKIGNVAEEALFRSWVGSDVKKLLDLSDDGFVTSRAGNLGLLRRHGFSLLKKIWSH
jgi:hypothetical protein